MKAYRGVDHFMFIGKIAIKYRRKTNENEIEDGLETRSKFIKLLTAAKLVNMNGIETAKRKNCIIKKCIHQAARNVFTKL